MSENNSYWWEFCCLSMSLFLRIEMILWYSHSSWGGIRMKCLISLRRSPWREFTRLDRSLPSSKDIPGVYLRRFGFSHQRTFSESLIVTLCPFWEHSMQNLRQSWGMLTDQEQFMNLQSINPDWTCPKYCGRLTLISKLNKRNTTTQDSCTNDYYKGHNMSK